MGVLGLPVVLGKADGRRQNDFNKTQASDKFIKSKVLALAPVLRQGGVYLGVGTGRGLSSACGSAKAEACEMSIDLCTR